MLTRCIAVLIKIIQDIHKHKWQILHADQDENRLTPIQKVNVGLVNSDIRWLPLDRDTYFALLQATYGTLKDLLQGFVTYEEHTRHRIWRPNLNGRSCKLYTSRTAKRTPHIGKRFAIDRKKTKLPHFVFRSHPFLCWGKGCWCWRGIKNLQWGQQKMKY